MRILDFLSNKSTPGVDNNSIELISLHIPKSAGTSFRNTLKQEYGEREVIRLDINNKPKVPRINEKIYEHSTLPKGTRVIHGHFCPADLHDAFILGDDIPMITWLRDPVERVISNYYYLTEILAKELNEQKKGLNLLSRLQRSLMEYARADRNRNRISKFLRGSTLQDFSFVGIQEFYSEDLSAMSKQFSWTTATEFKYNKTAKKYNVSEENRAEIAKLNQLDIAIYEEGLALRQKRISG